MSGAVSSATTFREAIQRIVAGTNDLCESDPAWLPMFIEFWAQATRDEHARKIVAGSLQECRGLVAEMLAVGQRGGLVRADLDIEAAAVILMGTFDGAAFQYAIDPEAVNLRRLEGPLAELVERFVGVDGAEETQSIRQPMSELFEKYTSEKQHEPEGGTP
jgi:hypothetical protein